MAFISHPTHADQNLNGHALLDAVERNMLIDRAEAERLLQLSATDAIVQNSQSLQSYYHNLLAYHQIMNGALAMALENIQQAKDFANASDNQDQLGDAFRREGFVYDQLGQYPKALEVFIRSMNIFRAIDSPKVTLSLDGLINIYESLDQYDKQAEYSWISLEEALKHKNTQAVASAHHNLGLVFLSRKEYEQARYHFEQELDAHNQSESPFLVTNYYGFARLELAEGRLEEAAQYIEKAKAFIDAINFTYALPDILFVESDIRLAQGQRELATQLLNRAAFLSEQIKSTDKHITALEKLAAVYEQGGEFQKSLAAFKKKTKIADEAQLAKERQLLTINQARLDLETKNRQIEQLQLEQKISSQQLQLQVLLLTSAVITMTILVVFTVRLQRQKKALRKTSAELQRATDAKSSFVARMSHEIRTPINAIIGLTKLSLRSSEDQQQATNLKQIEDSSQTLLGLVNDILDFSKIEAGKMTLESKPFSLDDVIESSMRMIGLKAHEKGVELSRFISPDVPLRIRGDALRLQQVLNNLLSNAIKFTDEGSISVVVNRLFNENSLVLRFEVKDTGTGMSSTQKERLFSAFSQADESITRRYGGTGLGLSISKQLVELMGGQIGVESVPSQGSVFYFTITTQKVDEPKLRSFNASNDKLRVLVIDHDPATCELCEQTFNRMDLTVTIANDGMSGITLMRIAVQEKQPYDIILLNWKMPHIDGVEVASIVREEFRETSPHIIMLAEHDLATLKALVNPLGISCFLTKPVSASAIFDAIINLSASAVLEPKTSAFDFDNVPDFSAIHILLAEDNALNRKVAIGYLKDTKARISVAENGQRAVDIVQQDNSIDLILMDIQMPVMDGLTATQKIRQDLKLNVPIIAMTAHAIDEDIERTRRVGMNAHIVKPIEPAALIDVIKQLVN